MFQFTEDCMTGIESIDDEHRQLFQVMNESMELLQDPNLSVVVWKNLMNTLQNYVDTHFETEEAYMESVQDPELALQKREHAFFAEKVKELSEENVDEEASRVKLQEIMEFLSRWLYRHILGSDIMIGLCKPAAEVDNLFEFSEKYMTGIPFVDEEHKRLFEIIKDTNDIIHAQFLHDKFDEIMRIVTELTEYTRMHFHDEEEYMESISYAGLPAQRDAHEAFVEKLESINLDAVDERQQEYLEELIGFLLNWLVNHIIKMDKKIPIKK